MEISCGRSVVLLNAKGRRREAEKAEDSELTAYRLPPNCAGSALKRKARHEQSCPRLTCGLMLPAMSTLPAQFSGVTVLTKANIYFDGKVISHTVLAADGAKKTLGLIYPGSYHFATGAPERMEIVAGSGRVTLDGATASAAYATDQHFDVPGNSGFTIEVADGICEYICSFL